MNRLDKNITPMQKLHALGHRFYGGFKWEPKVGDLYTICRPDLKLFKIVREENGDFYFICNEYEGEGHFPVDGFSTEDFGLNRCYVPEWVFEVKE